jgi:hypothetical protein
MEASLAGATTTKPQKWIVDAAGRVIHIGWVCQGGTLCVATGQDRRLGDYFTNTLDARGWVLIATGDTRLSDPTTGGPLPTARRRSSSARTAARAWAAREPARNHNAPGTRQAASRARCSSTDGVATEPPCSISCLSLASVSAVWPTSSAPTSRSPSR